DNMTMFIVGDVDLEHVETMLRQAVPFLYGDPAHPMSVPLARVSSTSVRPPDPPEHGMYQYEGPVATPEIWIGWTLPGAYRDDNVLIEFITTLTDLLGSEAVTEDDDIASVTAESLPGVQSTILYCRVMLREGTHPARSADH